MKNKNTAIEFIGISEKEYTVYSYLIRALPGGEIVGDCRLRVGAGLDTIGNIGYSVDEEHRNQGHATYACARLLEHARSLGLEKAYAVCQKDNTASIRVCEKLGGIPDGDTDKCVRFCFSPKK